MPMLILEYLKEVTVSKLNGKMIFAFLYLGSLALLAIYVPFLNLDPTAINSELIGSPQAPSLNHLFGTDELGRDILLRSIFGDLDVHYDVSPSTC